MEINGTDTGIWKRAAYAVNQYWAVRKWCTLLHSGPIYIYLSHLFPSPVTLH